MLSCMKDSCITRLLKPGITLLLLFLLTGCSPSDSASAADRPTPLLLISIDGFRHDYLGQFPSPGLDRLMAGGLRADSLQLAFPTKTFATHYTLVTGRYPGRHGVVANSMWDPERRASFSMRNRAAVNDGYWYQGGEPIWVTAEKQGRVTATYFWPGSEAMIQRRRPSYYQAYDGRVSHRKRIDQVLAWLDLPAAERPDLITLYFSRVDSRAHSDGPAAASVFKAAAEIDRQLVYLISGLEQRGLFDAMNLIIVSDHGVSAVSPARTIALDDHLDLRRVRVSDWGPAAQIWATGMSAQRVVEALQGVPHLRVWKRDEIPARYHFGSHRRVPDVLAEADPGWLISSRLRMREPDPPRGMHGWDPALTEMHGLFIAHGPDFIPGARAPAFAGVDLYALMAHLLGLKPADHDGRLESFLPYLGSGPAPAYRRFSMNCAGQPLELRLGPEHMAVHLDAHIHVLERKHTGRWHHADLFFELDEAETRGHGRIDGHELRDCRLRDA